MDHSFARRRLLVEVLAELARRGYPLGAAMLTHVEAWLAHAPADAPLSALRTQLAPLFAGSPEEQRQFYALFDEALHRVEVLLAADGPSTVPDGVSLEHVAELVRSETRWRRVSLGLLLALAAAMGAFFTPLQPWSTGAMLLGALVLAGYTGWRLIERPAVRWRYVLALPVVAVLGFGLKQVFFHPEPVASGKWRQERLSVRPGERVKWRFVAKGDTAHLHSLVCNDQPAAGETALGGQFSIDTAGGGTLTYTAPPAAQAGTTDTLCILLRYTAGYTDTLQLLVLVVAPDIVAPPSVQHPDNALAEMPLPFPRDVASIAIDPEQQRLYELYHRWEWWVKVLLFLLLAAALWAYARWDEQRRARYVAEIQQRDRPPYVWQLDLGETEGLIDFGKGMTVLLNRLRQREVADLRRIDVRATVKASARRGGRAELVYREQTRPPEYLLLIDRFAYNDHRACLFDTFHAEMRRAEVHVERFFYDGDPRVCFNEAHPEGVRLGELLHHHREARLLLVGDAQGLLVPSTGRLAPWTHLFEGWRQRALLLPRPTRSWGSRERLLRGLFAVLPASIQGLDCALEYFETRQPLPIAEALRRVADAPTEPIEFRDDLLRSLRRYYPEPLLQWIAACAVYPALHWELTLFLGRFIGERTGENLVTAHHLREMARLPWFVEGRIPDRARLILVEYLAAQGLETPVREALHQCLNQVVPPPPDSIAWDDYRMNIVLNELLLNPHDPNRHRQLKREFEQYLAAGKQIDFVGLRRLEGQLSRLDYVVPNRWKKYFFRHGSARFGLRPLAQYTPWLAAAVLTLALVRPPQPPCAPDHIANYESQWLCLEDPTAALLYCELLTAQAIEAQQHTRADSLANAAERLASAVPTDTTAPDHPLYRYYLNTSADYYNYAVRTWRNAKTYPPAAADSLRAIACDNLQRATARYARGTTLPSPTTPIQFVLAQQKICLDSAQTADTLSFSLSGLILDATTGRPIPNATVRATNAEGNTFALARRGVPSPHVYTAYTESNGRYTLKELPLLNQVYLYAVAPGYDGAEMRTPARANLPTLRLASAYATREAATWKKVTAANTPEAYGEYLTAFPDGPNAPEARRRQAEGLSARERNAWENTARQHTIPAYETYLQQYPNGVYRAEAQQRIAQLHWNNTRQQNTPNAYDDFLRKYPDSPKADSARLLRNILLDDATWQRAQQANHPDSCRAYLQQYPQGRHAAEAQKCAQPQQPPVQDPYIKPDMVFVRGGTFNMGCTSEQRNCDSDEKPVMRMTVRDFYIGRYAVTFEEYDAFCVATGRQKPWDAGWGRGRRPVINVHWYDAVEYCNWLSEQEGLTKLYTISGSNITVNWNANGYRLPTEAEWEYAARGGHHLKNYLYSGSNDVSKVAWYNANSGGRTQLVGQKQANQLGLYDMSGNVWEWCWDWYGAYPGGNRVDYRGPASSSSRVLRGGSWSYDAQNCRVALRYGLAPARRDDDLGFRLVLQLPR